MLNREDLISHLYREDDQRLGQYIIDKIELVLKKKSNEITCFLDPYQTELALAIIKQVLDVNYITDGGFKEAERKRIIIFPEFIFPDLVESSISILKITGNFRFQAVNHRDYLGSLLGLGIKRDMIGDVLIEDNFAQIVVARELKDYIILNLDKVHKITVQVAEIDEKDLIIPAEKAKIINATVASLRLDAVASAGFNDSRSKIVRDIKSEKVRLNWRSESNPAQKVEEGALISIRGRGRIKVLKVEGLSHRGRIKLKIQRYI